MQPQQQNHCVIHTLRSGRPEFRLSRQAATQMAQALESLLSKDPCIEKADAVQRLIGRLRSIDVKSGSVVQLAVGDMVVIGSVCARLKGLGSAAADVLKTAHSYVSQEHATHTAPADVHFGSFALDRKILASGTKSHRRTET